MGIFILDGGLQTTLQDSGRPSAEAYGMRHLGIPQSGAADTLSLAIANHLVGKSRGALAIEMTLVGAVFRIERDVNFALAGAPAAITLNGRRKAMHETCTALEGDILSIGAMPYGARTYLAFSADIDGEDFLGSRSTYAPAHIGGYAGRALKAGDRLSFTNTQLVPKLKADKRLLLQFNGSLVLRAVRGPHFKTLQEWSQNKVFTKRFTAGQRASRMGVILEDNTLTLKEAVSLDSFAVFPGSLQCPPSGAPFLLLADAQTTGGYPVIAQIIQADLPLTGQIRPGDTIRLYEVSAQQAQDILINKDTLVQTCFQKT